MSEWISVKDRLPEFGDNFIAYYSDSSQEILLCSEGVQDDYGYCDPIYFDKIGDLGDSEFTHWMPLPPPPEEEE